MRPSIVFMLYLSLVGLAAAQPTPTPPASEFVPLCDPANFSTNPPLRDLPVPDLPDQFSFIIEANVIDLNFTAILTEHYDGPGNRGWLEVRYNEFLKVQIIDYNLGEIFLISGDDCMVLAIADNPQVLNFTFGIENRNGTSHIGSPRTFFEGLKQGVSTRYVGEDVIRGIPTQHWQACFYENFYSNLIDYYFVAKSWDYTGQGQFLDMTQMVPVQFSHDTLSNDSYMYDGTVYNDYRIYSIVDFKAGPDSVPDSVFQVPNGLACTGRFPGKPVPQIPPFFSTYVQQVATNVPTPTIQTYRVRQPSFAY